jgi:hypothetical protein
MKNLNGYEPPTQKFVFIVLAVMFLITAGVVAWWMGH